MKIEIRGNQVILDGYVNVVSRDSRPLPSSKGQFIEQMVPGVFDKALRKADDVEILFNHKQDRKLGSIQQGNLELFEDSIGLRAKATISDDEVIEKARNNKLKGWSFGFISNMDKWEDKDGIQKRYVSDIDLIEVSVLDMTPAYVATSIEARDENAVVQEIRSYEPEEIKVFDIDDQIRKLKIEIENKRSGIESAESYFEISGTKATRAWIDSLNAELRNMEVKLQELEKENEQMEDRSLQTTTSVGNHAEAVQVNPIVKKLEETSEVYALAKKVPFTAADMKVPYENDLSDALFVDEGNDVPEAALNLSSLASLSKKRAGLGISLSKQLMYAADASLEEHVKDLLVRRVGKVLEKSILAGTASNEFKGIAPDASVVSSSVAITPVVDSLQTIVNNVLPEYRKNSKWYMSPGFFAKVSVLKESDGTYHMKYINVNGKIIPTFLGFQIEITDSLADGTTIGQVPVLFGSIADCYTVGVAEEVNISEYGKDTTQALRGAVGFRAEFCGDGRVTNYQAVSKGTVA